MNHIYKQGVYWYEAQLNDKLGYTITRKKQYFDFE